MRKKLLIALILITGPWGAGAQTFADLTSRFQAILDSMTHETALLTPYGDTVGITFAVSVPGIGTWEGASGPALPGVPMTTNTTVGINSDSKLYTAVILLKLQENGILSLDDHIGRWLPMQLNHVDTAASIRQLLQHETGIFDYGNDHDDFYTWVFDDVDAFWSYERLTDSIGAPHFQKGTAHRYSNTGYMICAWIIEQATGHSLSQNLHQYITTPLGLTRTLESALDTAAMNQGPASWSEADGVWYPPGGSTALSSMFRGAGSIVSTGRDMAAFYQALLAPNSNFLAPASRHQLLDFEAASSYGLGIMSRYSFNLGSATYAHGGNGGAGYNSESFYDRTTGASFFFAINSFYADQAPYSVALRRAFRSHFPRMANDAGISDIVSPHGTLCNGAITPVVVLTNHGSVPLTNATIGYRVDGGSASLFAWTGNLAAGASMSVSLPAINATHGKGTLVAWTQNPNGSAEGFYFNDTMRSSIFVDLAAAHNGYFTEDFESNTSPILVWNSHSMLTGQWGVTKLTGFSGNHSLVRSSAWGGARDTDVSYVDMPLLKLVAGTSPTLSFRYAYSAFPSLPDSLEALISTDCGTTWTSLYYKGGLDLSQGRTSDENDGYGVYFPHTAAEWHEVNIPLDDYSGDMLVRFRHISGLGDNLYIDDIALGAQSTGIAHTEDVPIKVYPNPAHDKVMISGLPLNTPVTLTDIAGRALQTTVTTGASTQIDVSRLTPGVYLLSTPYGTKKIVRN